MHNNIFIKKYLIEIIADSKFALVKKNYNIKSEKKKLNMTNKLKIFNFIQ